MLCLSGFELYSRWVPLFFLSPSSKTRESLQPRKPLQKSLLQPKILNIYTYYCSKVQFSVFFEYPAHRLFSGRACSCFHEQSLRDFLFYVILAIPYLRARTKETSSLPNDSMRPPFKQLDTFSGIPTVYFNCKYFP